MRVSFYLTRFPFPLDRALDTLLQADFSNLAVQYTEEYLPQARGILPSSLAHEPAYLAKTGLCLHPAALYQPSPPGTADSQSLREGPRQHSLPQQFSCHPLHAKGGEKWHFKRKTRTSWNDGNLRGWEATGEDREELQDRSGWCISEEKLPRSNKRTGKTQNEQKMSCPNGNISAGQLPVCFEGRKIIRLHS